MKKIDYRKRWITSSLKEALDLMEQGALSVITLTGARQTGKTTLARNEEPFKNWHYINLDSLEVLAVAKRSPESLLTVSQEIIVDEVQRAPEILLKIKELADTRGTKFLLTGSANLLLLRRVSETLAGRAAIFTLPPFASREWDRKEPGVVYKMVKSQRPQEKTIKGGYPLEERIVGGSMPSTLLLKKGFRMWWEGYIKTYIERDLRDISSISNLADFHRLLEILAHVSGGLLEESSIARRIGISVATVHRWINLLETSFILFKLRPYLKSRIARIRKTPKIYLVDPALSFYLMGKSKNSLKQEDWGRLFENFVFLQLLAMKSAFGGELYFWRFSSSSREKEVNFIWEVKGKTLAIEAKDKESVSIQDAENILYFCKRAKCDGGFIVYRGERVYELLRNVWAVSVWEM